MENFENEFDDPTPMTRGEFRRFLKQHFAHAKRDLAWIKGAIWVLVPFMALILGLVVMMLMEK